MSTSVMLSTKWLLLAFIPFGVSCGSVVGNGRDRLNQTARSSPASVTLVSNQREQLAVSVSRTFDTAVAWSATGGLVDVSDLDFGPTETRQTRAVATAASYVDPSKTASSPDSVDPPNNLTTPTNSLRSGQGDIYRGVFTATDGPQHYDWRIDAGATSMEIVKSVNGNHKGASTAVGTTKFAASLASGTAPLTYVARTDDCVTGSESGCMLGALIGQAGSVLSFLLRSTDAVPFSEEAAMNSAATDPDFGSYMVMATDEKTALDVGSSTPYKAVWNMGSGGEWDAFSVDSKMLLVHTNYGNATILYLNPSSIHAQTCATVPCVTRSHIGSGYPTNTYNLAINGSWDFSRAPEETNVLYELNNPPTKVSKIRICPNGTSDPGCSTWTGPGPLLRTTYVDFTSDTPDGCGALPTGYMANWKSGIAVADDGSVAYGLTGGQDWHPLWTPAVTESFILPKISNRNKYGFQATTVTGPTGEMVPDWGLCNQVGWCMDGGVTWTSIGELRGQGPGFDIVGYNPWQGCWRYNTRIGKIYRGTGNASVGSYATTNDDIVCTREAIAGSIPYPCYLPDVFTLHSVSQTQNGQYVVITPTGGEGANSPGSWNSGTLSGQISSAIWAGPYSTNSTYVAHNVVTYDGLYYTSVTNNNKGNVPPIPPTRSNIYWTQTEAYPRDYIFSTSGTMVAPCTDYLHCGGHTAQGYLTTYYGSHYESSAYPLPVINGRLNPGIPILATRFANDAHGTYRNSGNRDLPPVFLSTTDVPDWPTRYRAPCYVEICAAPSSGEYTLYRFGHEYNTGSNSVFSIKNGIGVVSYLGDLVAFGSDMMGTRGDLSAPDTICKNNLRGMYKPAAGLPLDVGDTVYPVTDNPGNYIYQATVKGITSGTEPTDRWSQTYPAGKITQMWGGATIQNIGRNTCRGDVVILDALSAHAAP